MKFYFWWLASLAFTSTSFADSRYISSDACNFALDIESRSITYLARNFTEDPYHFLEGIYSIKKKYIEDDVPLTLQEGSMLISLILARVGGDSPRDPDHVAMGTNIIAKVLEGRGLDSRDLLFLHEVIPAFSLSRSSTNFREEYKRLVVAQELYDLNFDPSFVAGVADKLIGNPINFPPRARDWLLTLVSQVSNSRPPSSKEIRDFSFARHWTQIVPTRLKNENRLDPADAQVLLKLPPFLALDGPSRDYIRRLKALMPSRR